MQNNLPSKSREPASEAAAMDTVDSHGLFHLPPVEQRHFCHPGPEQPTLKTPSLETDTVPGVNPGHGEGLQAG